MEADNKSFADYILKFFQTRNGGELQEAFDKMTVGDFRCLVEELTMIVEHRGKPPNWV